MYLDKASAQEIGKKQGTYITLSIKGVKLLNSEIQLKEMLVLTKTLSHLLKRKKIKDEDMGLVVGLGNRMITPDALGPLAVEQVIVTNHLFKLKDDSVSEGYRKVTALSPGVMGVTGIETSDIITSVVKKVKPDFVIVIDALAAKDSSRLGTTIQLTDTGIHPGSGVGNIREELSEEKLGIPVIALGIPTVVDTATIVNNTFNYVMYYFGREVNNEHRLKNKLITSHEVKKHEGLSEADQLTEEGVKTLFGQFGSLSEEEKEVIFHDILQMTNQNMIVTPKDIDRNIEDMAKIIASSINGALHEDLSNQEQIYFTK